MQFTAVLITCLIMFSTFFLVYFGTDRLLNYFSKTKKPFNYKFAAFSGIMMVVFYLLFSNVFK
ncbi:hypothetical protein ERX27_09655 [Macrococcus brunensis]|uniref:Uncharacterized protein n=1 Tax=Macrococcus brunensis TaxID=198483 RepID=A0A4R6BB52_9STAP|nr:hypothetical protein [Macrococcus brunensis]TDL94192.1 hypothetical protein ERX27_09655 [Macrococcus brunensis]